MTLLVSNASNATSAEVPIQSWSAFAALGGADTISLGDISETGVRQVALDLAGTADPAGDGQPDTISIAAVSSDAIATTLGAGAMAIVWHGVRYSVTGVEPANDRFILQTSAPLPPAMSSSRSDVRLAEARP